MHLCDDIITIYTPLYDPQTGHDVYHGTVISGVSWYQTTHVTVELQGLKAADSFKIRIPVEADFGGKAYVLPGAWDTARNPAKLWTIKQGDIVLHGAHLVENPSMAELQRDYPDSCTVLSVTDNRRAPNAKHWRILGR